MMRAFRRLFSGAQR